jgi:hypothetical protein
VLRHADPADKLTRDPEYSTAKANRGSSQHVVIDVDIRGWNPLAALCISTVSAEASAELVPKTVWTSRHPGHSKRCAAER